MESDNSHSGAGIGVSEQLTFFPEVDPIKEDLKKLDINQLSPIEALNVLYELKRKHIKKEE